MLPSQMCKLLILSALIHPHIIMDAWPDDEILKIHSNVTLRNVILTSFTQKWTSSIVTSDSASLWCCFYPIMMLTCCQWTSLFVRWSITIFPFFCWLCPKFFKTCCWHQIHISHLQHLMCLCTISNEMYTFDLTFQLFLEMVVNGRERRQEGDRKIKRALIHLLQRGKGNRFTRIFQ